MGRPAYSLLSKTPSVMDSSSVVINDKRTQPAAIEKGPQAKLEAFLELSVADRPQ
jgi:hypothetical protein